MTFAQAYTRNGMISLDGYSNKKTLKDALNDLMREVAKYNPIEAIEVDDELVEMALIGMKNIPDCWYLEVHEVSCASKWNEKREEMEYANGNWYLYCRFSAA